jgi:non-ribosomal peptide synthetase component E (peptide arylation enzyme)
LQKAGARTVLLIARHGRSEINYLSELTQPKAWIVPESYGKINYEPLIADIRKDHACIEHVILVRAGQKAGYLNLEDLIARGARDEASLRMIEERRPDPMELSLILPTGGSTGLPKAVPRTHNDFITNVEYHSRPWEITSEDTLLTVAPVSHGQGMLCGVGPAFLNYTRYVLVDSTRPEDICSVIEREKVTALPTVPALIQRIVNLEGIDKYDLRSLKKIYSGGAPSSPELVKAVYERLKCKFVNAYGSTEGPSAMTNLYDDMDTICSTVGRKDCPYTDFKVINQYGGEVPPGAEGELVTKGPTIFTGYFKSPEDNAQIFTKDGYYKTGDLARIDRSGIITLTGRIKETILRGGETISAIGIERLISSHPAVAEVAVIGMPDKDLGERICAYIVRKAGTTVTHEEIVAHLKELGASVMQLPERTEFVESIPTTGVGKADKKILKQDIAKKLNYSL